MTAQFATTQWSDVLKAGASTSPAARSALEELCSAYWYPLYAYVRRTGKSPDDARDLTQGFFEHLLQTDLLRAADPTRGRFRSFLLSCMKNYLSNERARAAALKRGGGVSNIDLDADTAGGRFLHEATDLEPDALYERRWSLTLMERAMTTLEKESASPERWATLKPLLTGSDREQSYKAIGEPLGMSDAAVRVAVHRMRQRYGELLRQEIAETVGDPAQVDDELKHALRSLGSAGIDA